MRSTIPLLPALTTLVAAGVSAAPVDRGATPHSPFYVPTKWPTVPFDVPESWAGLLPAQPAHLNNETYEYFFWYFESEAKKGKDDLVIWLNGGPGCSSLEGLFQENGPVLFPWNVSGEPAEPYVKLNPYSWTKVANVLWVEQPAATGFSQGTPDAKDERDVAQEFYSFLTKFYETFPEVQGKRLWLTGESYAGMYIPYIADHIYHAPDKNKRHGIDLQGLQINDPSWTNDFLASEAALPSFVQRYEKELGLNKTFLKSFYHKAKSIHVLDYVEKNLVYPPPAEGLTIPPSDPNTTLASELLTAASEANKYVNIYNVKLSKPIQDSLGFAPNGNEVSPKNIINDIPGFKKLIHAPEKTEWLQCSNVSVLVGQGEAGDSSPFPDQTVLPSVISKNKRTLIAHGVLDALLLSNGTQLAIQNLTWGGKRGFQKKPDQFFQVNGTKAGKFHEERGLTFVEVWGSGHMQPQDVPSSALKMLEYLVYGTSLDS